MKKHLHARRKSVTPTYISWGMMKTRCYNKTRYTYKYYGGRGIKVCARWQIFQNFLIDMGPRPIGTTLERIDNDGDYTPLNCKWADQKEQMINRSTTRWIVHKGERKSLKEWATHFGINYKRAHDRLSRGKSFEIAMELAHE